MTTGDAHWASGTKLFVLIKDEKGRFTDNPLWGDGWGWALFKSDAPDKQVATELQERVPRMPTFPRDRRIGSTSEGYPRAFSKGKGVEGRSRPVPWYPYPLGRY